LDHQEFVTIREEWRSRRSLQRLEYVPKEPLVPKNSVPQQPYVIYPVNSLELIFPNSEIDYDNVGKALHCFEIPGQAEPVSFVIHAFKDINDFSVNVSNLVSENGTIGSEMISIRRVEYNDQRWGEGRTKKYGTAPDYLGYENPTVTIPAGKNCQLWLKIYIPPTARPATYEGKVKIKLNGQPVELPLSVEVLPVKLLPNRVTHVVWHSPFLKDYAPSPIEVLKDMKEHGVIPIFYSTAQPVFGQNGDESTVYFVRQLESLRKVNPDARRIFIVMRDHIDLWRNLKCPASECSHTCSKFNFAYSRILKAYADLAESFGLDIYFSFEDEPFNDPHIRKIAYYCSSLAKSINLKTWSTHNLKMDTRLETKEDISEVYLNPLRQVLDVFVEHIGRIDKNAIETFVNSPSNLSYYTTYLATGCWPVYNRMLHGIYPFVIKSEFVAIYAYRDSCVDPYDDMDAQAIDADNSGLPDYLLTYPSWNGQILPTLSYEALAEGIEDSHLISTLQQLVEKALNSNDPNIIKLAKQTDNFLTNIRNRVSSDFSKNYWRHPPGPIDPMEKKILRDLNNGESEDYGIFNKIRRDVCDKIITLQNILGESRETDPSKLKNW
jgi:hypothetical protein